MIEIEYDIIVFQEENTYISYCPELDVSSCGKSVDQAKEMLKEAVRLFIEESEKMGTVYDILSESNFKKNPNGIYTSPRIVATEFVHTS
jgi:predicted RNase H-like HicB family nuclease